MNMFILISLAAFSVASSALSSTTIHRSENCLKFSRGSTVDPTQIPLNEPFITYSLPTNHAVRTYVTFENVTSEELLEYKERTKDVLDGTLTSGVKLRMSFSHEIKTSPSRHFLAVLLSFSGNSGSVVALSTDVRVAFAVPYQFRWQRDYLGIMSCDDKQVSVLSRRELTAIDLVEARREIQSSCHECMTIH